MNSLFDNLFIFEMANNHQGDLNHGLTIIREMAKIARKYNIKAGVKFQYRDLDTMIHPDYRERNDIKHIPRFLSTQLTRQEFLTMVEEVRNEGMITICTPFDEISVRVCLDHGIQILKVASCSASDWPLLEEIAAAKRPVIISTGGKNIADIDNIYNFFVHRKADFALMHCVGLYPTPNNMLQLQFIERLRQRYPDICIGYSGHEAPDNLDAVKIAVAKGASILERHVGIETESISLNAYSLNPVQADDWVASALTAQEICTVNGPDKYISQEEIDSLRSLMRGVYAASDITKDSPLKKENVFFAMPSLTNQMTSGQFNVKTKASHDYKTNEPVYENPITSMTNIVRSIIHDAKGMLYESRVVIGDQFEIELSHHYGLDHFRQFGALIVNVINREYCKKIIVQLPGQRHPNHQHRVKEETFQLLFGDLEVILDDKKIAMNQGDILIVERGNWHSFSTINGAVIEEISTTHVKGDSYYEDEEINRMDPMERKTILEDW